MDEFYGILRDAKMHWSDVKKLQAEMQRMLEMHTQEFKDFHHSLIDWNKTNENVFFVKTDDWKKEIDNLCDEFGCKRKNNSVVAVNAVYAVTPEWLKTHTEEEAMEYFRKCFKFHVKEYCGGNEDLMLCFVVHKDETSWHAHGVSVPLRFHKTINKRSGKEKEYWSLDAKKILGGRIEHSRRQDRFYNEVSKEFGLLRGTPKPISRRRHRDQMEMHLESLRNGAEVCRKIAFGEMEKLDKAIQTNKMYKENSQDQTKILMEMRELARSINESEKVLSEEYARLQKNFVYREWKILQERYPEIAKKVHQENIELKRQETSSNRKIVRNQTEKSDEIYR